MQLKHIKNILPPQEGAAKVCAMAWSPNNMKLAVCTFDRVILLFDEHGEKRDKFSTKPCDSKYDKKSYHVKAIAFSSDSTKICVAQTDNMIYVYKIGSSWLDKKTICNKFNQTSAVTALVWPPGQEIVFGTAEGKLRLGNSKTNKSTTLFGSNSHVISIAHNPSGTGFVSGHADGTIARFFFNPKDAEDAGEAQGKFCKHSCSPYALAWANSSVVVGGCDRRIVVYDKSGRVLQQFDYSDQKDEKEFTVAVCSPSGQSVVVGSFDRLRVLNWSPRKAMFDEGKVKEIENLYTISALAWKRDGSKLTAGTLCGGVELFDCCLKRTIYKNKFEMTHVGLSQVIVKNLQSGSRVVLKSFYDCEIDDVKIMGQERYLVGHTSNTLMLGDLQTTRLSEVQWQNSGLEKFFFSNENVCMIFNAGELSFVEYGQNEIMGSVRTEFMNPHQISARINERKQKDVDENKKIAYLIDLNTIAVMDMVMGISLGQISHEIRIDWLELNETGRILLFRDKRLKLHLYNVVTREQLTILNYCSYVQWVPGSDVVVAQNRNNLCIWYNIDSPERVSMFDIKGDIVEISRVDGKTEVIVNEGVSTVSYALDEGLIEFGTAIDDGDYGRAIIYLESLEESEETLAMWKSLSKLAMESQQLQIAERCYAALGNVSKARYLRDSNKIAEQAARTQGGNGFSNYQVRARMAILEKNLNQAESIYLEQNCTEEAIDMYQRLHKWDEAINVADIKCHPEAENLRRKYIQWLMDTSQEGRAGEMKERDGDFQGAVNMYMKAGLPARAARLVTSHDQLMDNPDIIARITSALMKGEMYEQAGDLFEKVERNQEALDCFKRGNSFRRAVDLACRAFPGEVVRLQERWGEHCVQQRQFDAAINHFIEAGIKDKAVDAAVQSRQWEKAVQILSVIDDEAVTGKYYRLIGKHYAAVAEHRTAEKFYRKAGADKESIAMYNAAGLWQDAHRIAATCMDKSEVAELYMSQAQNLESQGKFKEAEKLYVTVQEPDMAITMWKRLKKYSDMMRLVKQFHPELESDTHLHLAKELETEGNLRQAEHHFLEAKDWKTAVNMYRTREMWEDAYRVSKTNGSSAAAKQVAYMWAKSLGGDSAVKLLSKFGLVESGIEFASENCAFDFAYDLAKNAMKEKMPEIHLKHAMFLEDEGKFGEAEEQFIKANKPKEAVLMYVHAQDWDSAQRIAEKYDPDSLRDILIGQARLSFEAKDYPKGEMYLLRAEKPELVIKFYKEQQMWKDALRVCKEYVPSMLPELQDLYEQQTMHNSTKGIETLIQQAREYETSEEPKRAIDCYIKITPKLTSDRNVIEKCMTKAAELAVKYMDQHKALQVIDTVAPVLIEIHQHRAAAAFYLKVDKIKESIDAFIAAEDWQRAKKVAQELEPALVQYVDNKYKNFLKSEGKADTLASVDAVAGIDMYIERGEWDKALMIAKQKNPKVLSKYQAMYAAILIKDNKIKECLELFAEYGTPAIQQNYNIYKRIFHEVVNKPGLNRAEAFPVWSSLRNMFYSLMTNLEKSPDLKTSVGAEFNSMLMVVHYFSTRSAALSQQSLQEIAAKISTALLRFTDLIPVDKAFYEAGSACKEVGWDNQAVIFLNHYIDLVEAIEDGSADTLDHSDFADTDIPSEIPLPEKPHFGDSAHEEVKDWVLAASMDNKINPQLTTDERGVYEASLTGGATTLLPCVITGYPVLGNVLEFKNPSRVANKDDWNKFLMAMKVSHSQECQDVLRFIGEWCGGTPNPSYTFQ